MEKEIKTNIEHARSLLLNFSAANPLINTKNGITLLSSSIPSILGSTLDMLGIPYLERVPLDEKTKEFQSNLDNIPPPKSWTERRKFRNQIRLDLGMDPVMILEPTLENCALEKGINIEKEWNFEKTKVDHIRVLKWPNELKNELDKFRRKARLMNEEKGIESLGIGIGFLEYSIDDKPQKAPLIIIKSHLIYSVGKSYEHGFHNLKIEEDIYVNPVLSIYLKTKVGFDVPKFDGDIESYIKEFQKRADQFKWNVRKEVILSNFLSPSMILYNDLNKKEWKYDIEKPAILEGKIENILKMENDPYKSGSLFLDLDSSQHFCVNNSIVLDRMVIEGPPGTGKSQTIIGIILANIEQGKRILFCAQKAAALSVVKRRIDQMELGQFCLDLSQAEDKNKFQEILKKRMENQETIKKGKPEFDEKSWTDFHSIMSQNYKKTGMTFLDILSNWRIRKSTNTRDEKYFEKYDFTKEELENIKFFYKAYKEENFHKNWANFFGTEFDIFAIDKIREIEFENPESNGDDLDLLYNLPKNLKNAFNLTKESYEAIKIQENLEIKSTLDYSSKKWRKLTTDSKFSFHFWHALIICRKENYDFENRKTLFEKFAKRVDQDNWLKNSSFGQRNIGWDFDFYIFEKIDQAKEKVKMDHFETQHIAKRIGIREDHLKFVIDNKFSFKIFENKENFLEWKNFLNQGNKKAKLNETMQSFPKFLQDIVKKDMTLSEKLFYNLFYNVAAKKIVKDYPKLLEPKKQNKLYEEFIEFDAKMIEYKKHYLKIKNQEIKAESGNSKGKVQDQTEDAFISHALNLSRSKRSVRQFFEKAPKSAKVLFPIVLGSPTNIAQILPQELDFDLVIIDEASQMKHEESLSCLLRGKRWIVVGDTQQMPPTDFFKAGSDDESEDDIKIESLLSLARATFGNISELSWHYRSKNPSLIKWSNENFYNGNLKAPPSPDMKSAFELINVAGNYSKSINTFEAMEIVKHVKDHSHLNGDKSLMVAAMNESQAILIERMIEKERLNDNILNDWINFQNNTFEKFVVKSLENVQGDERDVVFISLTYGPENNILAKRFGPINQANGHKRLNVLLSRSRENCRIFSSFSSDMLKVEVKDKPGVKMFKSLIEYAENVQKNTVKSTQVNISLLEQGLKMALKQRGWEISSVGECDFTLPLCVLKPGSTEFLACIEMDGLNYQKMNIRDRDIVKPNVLKKQNWNIIRVWSTDWLYDPLTVVNNVEKQLKNLL